MKESITLMAGKYRNESKHRINGRENTGTKVNITLMVWKYRNKSNYHTNGREIQEQK
jgi:hypothetical protein